VVERTSVLVGDRPDYCWVVSKLGAEGQSCRPSVLNLEYSSPGCADRSASRIGLHFTSVISEPNAPAV
jgi:hypothetical protein